MINNTINKKFFIPGIKTFADDVSYVGQKYFSINASGTTDLYTCPSGKSARIFGLAFYNRGAATTFPVCYVKNGGVYYNTFGIDINVNANTYTTYNRVFMLNENETFAINFSSAQPTNFRFGVVEFDKNNPFKWVALYNGSSGNNLIYTVPAGKVAVFNNPENDIRGENLWCGRTNNAGGNYQFYWVPNGQSPSTTYSITNQRSLSTNSNGAALPQYVSFTASAGDMIYCNASSAGMNFAINFYEYDV